MVKKGQQIQGGVSLSPPLSGNARKKEKNSDMRCSLTLCCSAGAPKTKQNVDRKPECLLSSLFYFVLHELCLRNNHDYSASYFVF